MPDPIRRQRLAAYAALTRQHHGEPELLITRIAAHAHGAGQWNLPGGGVEHGEDPRDGVGRELFEEAGLAVVADRILDVISRHVIAPSPQGVLEDFHGVQLVFAAHLATDAVGADSAQPLDDPMITDLGGTTDAVAWVPIGDLLTGAHPGSGTVRAALSALGHDVSGMRSNRDDQTAAANLALHTGWRAQDSTGKPDTGEFWVRGDGSAYVRTGGVRTATRGDGMSVRTYRYSGWRPDPELDGSVDAAVLSARVAARGIELTEPSPVSVYADWAGPFATSDIPRGNDFDQSQATD